MSTTGLLAGGLLSSALGAITGLAVAVWCGGETFACLAATLIGAMLGSFIGWKLLTPTRPTELSGPPQYRS